MAYQASDKVQGIFDQLTALAQVKEAVEYIRTDQETAIKEQLEMVVIESPTFHEENRAQNFLERLKALGLENPHIDQNGNVVSLRKGKGNGPAIVIEGHMDTVFPFGTVKEPIFKDGKIYAPGICDDTRGLAVVLQVARAFRKYDIQNSGDIYFVGTVAEEGMGGCSGMGKFLDTNPQIDGCISIDGSDAHKITYQATGIKTVIFHFYGVGGHAYGAFGKVANPLHAAARAVAKIADFQVPETPRTTFAVSNFHAGNDAGIHAITQGATIKINYRSNSPEELEKLHQNILAAMQEACDEETKRWGMDTITFDYQILVDIPAGNQSEHAPIVEANYLAIASLGLTPELGLDGSTNANMPIGRGIPAVCIGRGGREGGVHTTNEWFDPEGVYRSPQQAFLVALMLSGIEGETPSILK